MLSPPRERNERASVYQDEIYNGDVPLPRLLRISEIYPLLTSFFGKCLLQTEAPQLVLHDCSTEKLSNTQERQDEA